MVTTDGQHHTEIVEVDEVLITPEQREGQHEGQASLALSRD